MAAVSFEENVKMLHRLVLHDQIHVVLQLILVSGSIYTVHTSHSKPLEVPSQTQQTSPNLCILRKNFSFWSQIHFIRQVRFFF